MDFLNALEYSFTCFEFKYLGMTVTGMTSRLPRPLTPIFTVPAIDWEGHTKKFLSQFYCRSSINCKHREGVVRL